MEKIWLKSYPSHVPAKIDLSQYNSLAEVIDEFCQKFADADLVHCLGSRFTYKDIYKRAKNFASYLQNECGFKKGDRFAIMLPNLPQYLVALYACIMAGIVIVNINPMCTHYELAGRLKNSGTKGILVLENFAKTLQEGLEDTDIESIIVTSVGDMMPFLKGSLINFVLRYVKRVVPKYNLKSVNFNKAVEIGEKDGFRAVEISQNCTAFLQYTGGTTGEPKAAVLSQRNILANLLQMLAWLDGDIKDGTESVLAPLPLYHIFAMTICGIALGLKGASQILIPDARNISSIIRALKKEPCTVFVGVNTLFRALNHNEEFKKMDHSKMKFAVGGGASVEQDVFEGWMDITGKPIIEGYGLTESSPVVTVNPVRMPEMNTIGLPLPSTDVKLLDLEGNEVKLGKPGELCVKGPQVMSGYWHAEEETKAVFTNDGYLKTGDIAVMDKRGFLNIVDRKKDMIVVSGFNVYPSEVEKVINNHPGVLESVVIGVPSERSGEQVKALVVKEDPNLDDDSLKAYCREYMTRYKVPKIIKFVDLLPKSPVGKILRRVAREMG